MTLFKWLRITYVLFVYILSNVVIIRSAARPSHSGGMLDFFHSPASSFSMYGTRLFGSVPMSSLAAHRNRLWAFS